MHSVSEEKKTTSCRPTVTTCGDLGSMLGGYGVFGSGAYIEKTFDLSSASHTLIVLEIDFYQIDSWDSGEGVEAFECHSTR